MDRSDLLSRGSVLYRGTDTGDVVFNVSTRNIRGPELAYGDIFRWSFGGVIFSYKSQKIGTVDFFWRTCGRHLCLLAL